ncbi:MAG: hypothetical protein V4697_01870 [Patescibacteria group bacterium]
MKLTGKIVAILSNHPDIPGLPTTELNPVNHGEPIEKQPSHEIVLQLARLQTLIFREHERGDISPVEKVGAMSSGNEESSYGATLNSMAQALSTQEDATRIVMMLEQLMVQIVRENIPTEHERLDVRYHVNEEWKVMWSPNPSRRFLG